MKIDLTKSSHVFFFVVFLPALSFAVGQTFEKLFPNWPFWVEGLSPLGAYALFYAFFDKTAWHWPVFRWAGVVTAPDLRGRWVGEQLSSFKRANGKPTESHVVMEVEQTFSSVTTHTYYHRWSNTHTASEFMDIEGQQYLVVIFESEPGVRHNGTDGANKGVVRLCYRSDEKVIAGTYYNTSGNFGEMKLKRTSRKLFQQFDKPKQASS
ncbi:MAG TPA: hypothetical protein VLE99_03240 [Candidatus Saccharimonadales bacterium]|nr:hypothetical protein [Candidatus Saccharimonadales bacterium]